MDVVVLLTVWTFLLREGMPLPMEVLISQENMNWTSAEEYCEKWNGRLIVLDSQEKWDYFTSHEQYQENHANGSKYWTGMRFNDSFACDQTMDYNPWVYNGWGRWRNYRNEPNWCRDQRCVKLQFNLMSTAVCKNKFQAVCEREMTLTTVTHNQPPSSSTELVDVNRMTSSNTFSKPQQHAAPSTLLTTSSTHGVDVTGYTGPFTVSPTTVPPVTSEVNNDTCRKCCSFREVNSRKLDQYELEETLIILRAQLAVNKTKLSAQRRKLISVYDSRPSSVAMGGVACAILVTVIGVIVVPDGLALLRFTCRCFQISHKTSTI